MGLTEWFGKFLFRDGELLDGCNVPIDIDLYYKKLAIETCIDLIANTLTTCEIKTYEKGKLYRGNMYYLFNVAPNPNQNASEFIHSLVHHLYLNNECLVVMQDGNLLVADDYTKNEYALKENSYKNVVVGDLKFEKIFYENEVMHFKLNDKDIMKVIDSLYDSYGKLLSSAINIYKRNNAKRYVVKGRFLKSNKVEDVKAANELFNHQFKEWISEDKAGSMMHLGDDLTLEDMSKGANGASSQSTSRDIRSLVDDILDFVAIGLHVPKSMLKGDLADIEKQTDNFIMFCIKPLAALLNAEFNRKMYTKKEYLERTYLKIDTTHVKIVDIATLATAADKLLSTGTNSINDNLDLFGREPLQDDWADMRFMTKNYQVIESVEQLKGGEGGI